MKQFIWIIAIILLSGIGFAIQLGPEMQSKHLQAGDYPDLIEYVDLQIFQNRNPEAWAKFDV